MVRLSLKPACADSIFCARSAKAASMTRRAGSARALPGPSVRQAAANLPGDDLHQPAHTPFGGSRLSILPDADAVGAVSVALFVVNRSGATYGIASGGSGRYRQAVRGARRGRCTATVLVSLSYRPPALRHCSTGRAPRRPRRCGGGHGLRSRLTVTLSELKVITTGFSNDWPDRCADSGALRQTQTCSRSRPRLAHRLSLRRIVLVGGL